MADTMLPWWQTSPLAPPWVTPRPTPGPVRLGRHVAGVGVLTGPQRRSRPLRRLLAIPPASRAPRGHVAGTSPTFAARVVLAVATPTPAWRGPSGTSLGGVFFPSPDRARRLRPRSWRLAQPPASRPRLGHGAALACGSRFAPPSPRTRAIWRHTLPAPG